MKKILSIFLISVLCFSNINSQDVAYDALVEKITTRPYPQWFKDAKLGIFIHWGLYSVPSYGGKESYAEWYLRGLQTGDTLRTNFLKRVYGQDFTYKDLTSYFKAELFNPDQWTELFKRAGAKYVVLVSKHHDGYALWPSKYSRNWNSMDNGPKRDIVGELTIKTSLKFLAAPLIKAIPPISIFSMISSGDPPDATVSSKGDRSTITELSANFALAKKGATIATIVIIQTSISIIPSLKL